MKNLNETMLEKLLYVMIDRYYSFDNDEYDFENNLKTVSNELGYDEFVEFSEQEILRLKRLFYQKIEQENYIDIPSGFEFDSIKKYNLAESRPKRYRRTPVQAFIMNISVPKSLEEMLEYFIGGNSAQTLVVDIDCGSTNFTVPKWAKRGDVVFFMHAKTANSTLTGLRTKLRQDEFRKFNEEETALLENEIASELAFHKKYGGTIFAIGRVNGRPEYEKDQDQALHWHTRLYCDIDRLFLLENPIHISKFNSFIKICQLGSFTPVYNDEYDKLKEMVMASNEVDPYFEKTYSTPIPSVRIKKDNWLKIGQEYRRSFILEEQFRSCYVNYLLPLLGDMKKIYKECHCYKKNKPITFVDNVIKFMGMWLPVEIKLDINAESNLEGQCNQYCNLDKLVLDNKEALVASHDSIIKDNVLVIDTYGVYLYDRLSNSIKDLYDLDRLKSNDCISEIRSRIITELQSSCFSKV